MADSSDSSRMEVDEGYTDSDASSSEHGMLPHEDGHIDGDDASDSNIEMDVDNEQNDSEVLDSEYISKLLLGSDNTFEYYGESDMEIAEDLSSVNNSEVTEVDDKGKENKVDCQKDIGHTGDDRENRWKIRNMTFLSEPAAYVFYNSYAKEHGFSIRKDKFKNSKGPSKEVRKRTFVCSREGKRQDKFLPLEERKYKPRAESRCGCAAKLVVMLDKSSGVWRVQKFDDNHNHMLARPDEVPFLWSHRRIKDFQRAEILAMAAAGIRKHMIMSSFISKYGRYSQVGFTRKDLYNMCAREKRKLLASGDAATAIGIMKSRKEKDPDFFFDHQLDDKGRLQCLFWCDSQSRQDYTDYGDVVVFDSTYKMNRYGMPFVPFVGLNNLWACHYIKRERKYIYLAAKNIYESNVSDDAKVRNHGCGRCHDKSDSSTKDKFEEGWHAYVRKWQTEKTKSWLKRMFKKKELWAAAYLADGFWLGMKSNQRSESLNSCLHLHLDYGMTLVDLIVHYENAIVRLRENEARDDCTASQTVPVTVTKWQEIELAMANAFTPANFYMLQEELSKIDDIVVEEKNVGIEGSVGYLVAWINKRRNRFYVDYTPSNVEQSIECSCRRMIRRGIPCKHILFVLVDLKLVELPTCIVLPRLSKAARRGFPARRTSDLFGWGFSGAEERKRYTELSVLASEALHVACKDPVLYNQLKATMQEILSKRRTYDTPKRAPRKRVKNDAEDNDSKLPLIDDPVKVKTKGVSKKNKKKGKNSLESKNGRPLDYSEKRRLSVCSACKKPGHKKNSIKCQNHPRHIAEMTVRQEEE